MTKIQKILLLIVVLALIAAALIFFLRPAAPSPEPEQPFITGDMIITSLAFENNQSIPAKYTCDGENINPPLLFGAVPDGAKSLALIVDDPDAPGRTFVHWTVWNINPNVTRVIENTVPAGGIEGRTDFGRPGYGGPCPPSGSHRYQFKLYALDLELNLDASAGKKELEQALDGRILDQAILVGLYQRQ